jgi:hypothetical protein
MPASNRLIAGLKLAFPYHAARARLGDQSMARIRIPASGVVGYVDDRPAARHKSVGQKVVSSSPFIAGKWRDSAARNGLPF